MLEDAKLRALLDDLHTRSAAQESATAAYFAQRTWPWTGMEDRDHQHFADKLVALDRDKAQFCYGLCRASGARRIVELGTSYGVSTLYLAAAVRDNGGGLVTATEWEPAKTAAARANFAAAGLAGYIDLREGDLRETLKTLDGPIDFVLFDVWIDAVRPALDLLLPHLRQGAVICTDNTAGERNRANYASFFEVVDDPAQGFWTTTLPFAGGFEMTVKSR